LPKLPTLQVIICSTRPTRIGAKVADWFIPHAAQHGGFAVERVDLQEIALPLLDEPKHPKLREYEHAHTKRWSATVDRGDAFAFVLPEYDHGPPASVINALQYLVHEWTYKPCCFVSYGGVSAGTRSMNALKIVLNAQKMMPMMEAVSIPFVAKQLDKETGVFDPGDVQVKAARAMLDELVRWERAMRPLRSATPAT
jgi:NAD(P)H-dependent FMN reductase